MGKKKQYKYDIVQAYICSFLSDQAYLDPENIIIPDIKSFKDKKTDTEGFSVINGGVQYISFRGTEITYKDFKTDMKVFKTRRHYGKVHSGFCRAYESVRSNIIPPKADKVIFTGHSLGGALAQIAAVEWATFYENIDISVYTFGSPKVFSYSGKRSYNKKVKDSYHFALHADIIPWVPFFNYWKTRNLIYINSKNKIVDKTDFIGRNMDRFKKIHFLDGKLEILKDHNIKDYHRIIKNNMTKGSLF